MEFAFASDKLERELSDDRAMQRAYGQRKAEALKLRLTRLAAAERLSDIPVRTPPDHLHQLGADRDEQFVVKLPSGWGLMFVVDHNPIPQLPDSGIDRDKVTAIRFVEVGNYHE